jgi:tetratricopeptide (TPR) repeat protein
MRQVLLRAYGVLRWPYTLLTLLVLAGGGAALVLVPLFGVPGYELGQALALGVGILGGGVGIAAGFQERRLLLNRDPRPAGALRLEAPLFAVGAAVGASLTLLLAALAVPFLTALAHALVSTECNPLANVGFYPLLTVPSALLAAAAGVLAGLTARKWWSAGALYALFLLASGALTAWPIYFGPQVYAFDHFLGYFPGPLYDEALEVRPPVYWFRLQTMLIACAVWLFTVFCLDLREARVKRPHLRPGPGVLLAALALAAAAIEAQGPELGIRTTNARLEKRLGGVRETEHFRIVYFRGKSKEALERLERDLEFRHHQLKTFLGGAPEEPINVYVYRNAEEKLALVGAGATQFAKPWQLALHINDAPFPHPVLKHELLHVMAAPFGAGPFRTTVRFGVAPQMAIIEGLAVAGDNRVDDLTLHQWASAMRRRKLAPDLRELFQPNGFYGAPASRAYMLAGSFLRYLADTYGTEKLRSLYLQGDFVVAYGKGLGELITEWGKFVDAIPLDARAEAQAYQRFRKPSLFARPCAREVAALERAAGEFLRSDPEQALVLYQRCALLQPDEPSFRLGEASALAKLDRPAEADAVLARLAATLQDKPALEADVAMARGDIAWRAGSVERAEEQYRRVLELEPGPAQDRTARVKLAGVGSPEVGRAIRAYFEEGQDDVKLLMLREALDRARDDAHVRYLIGRRLTQSQAPELAVQHLSRALESELPEPVRKEALRLKVQAEYLAGDCAAVRHDAGALPDYGAAFELWIREWVERCDFEEATFKAALVPEGPFR